MKEYRVKLLIRSQSGPIILTKHMASPTTEAIMAWVGENLMDAKVLAINPVSEAITDQTDHEDQPDGPTYLTNQADQAGPSPSP